VYNVDKKNNKKRMLQKNEEGCRKSGECAYTASQT
jgi:hypothetical protein